MNTKIKLITIILMTLAVVGGGVIYFNSQLGGAADGSEGGKSIAWYFENGRGSAVEILPGVSPDQLASFKSGSRSAGSSMTRSDGEISSLVELSAESSLDKRMGNRGASSYKNPVKRGDKEVFGDRNTTGGSGMMAFSTGSRSGNASSGGGYTPVSPLSSNGIVTYVPKPYTPGSDLALVDPEPVVLGDDNKIVPVGGSVYILALFSIAYGIIRFRRRGV